MESNFSIGFFNFRRNKMKKNIREIILLFVAVLILASCATTKGAEGAKDSAKVEKTKKIKKIKFNQAAYDSAYAAGDYSKCVSMLYSKKADKNAVKNYLDIDMLLYFTSDYIASGKGFLETQGQMQRLSADMTSGKTMQAALGGENSTTYTGAVYERLLAYSMRTVNAIGAGELDVAKGVIYTYTGDYKDVIVPLLAQQKEVEASSDNMLGDEKFSGAMSTLNTLGVNVSVGKVTAKTPAKAKAVYETSPFLSYLGAVVFAANEDSDHAKEFSSILKTSAPNIDVSEAVKIPAGKGRLEVVALSGTLGKRTEGVQEMNFGIIPGTGFPMKFKIVYPVFDISKQNHKITSVNVKLSDGTAKKAVVVENFDNAVALDVANKARGAYNRSVFRNITKNAASIPASVATYIAAKETLDHIGSNVLARTAAQIGFTAAKQGMIVALEAVVDAEKADVRQASYFPHLASAAGFSVAPGTYTVTVEYLSGNNIVETKKIENVVVKEGRVSVEVSSCEK